LIFHCLSSFVLLISSTIIIIIIIIIIITSTIMSSSTAPSNNNNMVIKIALTAGGERTKVIDETEARRMVERFESIVQSTRRRFGNKKYTVVIHKLDLSCRVWTPTAMQLVLQPFLERHNVAATVEILKCDDMIASLPTDEGLATLACLADIFSASNNNNNQSSSSSSVLQEVNFNDNALGTRGLQRLAPLLSLPSVTRVYLQNCGISGEAARETLLACLQGRALTHVALGLNQMGEMGATCLGTILQQHSKLEYLSYKGSRPLRKGTHGLLQGLALADTSRLRHLDLNDTDLTSSFDLLREVLTKSPQLQSLVLRDGALSQAGLRVVIQALYASAARLRCLDLGAMFGTDDDDGSNDDDDDDDDENETKFVEAATELGTYLATQWSTLETLVLGDTEWHNAGILALMAASGPLFGGSVAENNNSTTTTGLRVFNLEACRLSGSDVLHVLCHNPISTLHELNLVDNPDLTSGAALKMLQNDVYSKDVVKIDDDLEEEEDDDESNAGADNNNDDDVDVNALAAELSLGAHIIAD
jgi:hypothetical protein